MIRVNKFKRLILVQDGKYEMFDSLKEMICYLLGDDYYSLSSDARRERVSFKMSANSVFSLNENNISCFDEICFVYWLLLNTNIFLLEKKDSNIFTGTLSKSGIYDDYIIVNKYAKSLYDDYIASR